MASPRDLFFKKISALGRGGRVALDGGDSARAAVSSSPHREVACCEGFITIGHNMLCKPAYCGVTLSSIRLKLQAGSNTSCRRRNGGLLMVLKVATTLRVCICAERMNYYTWGESYRNVVPLWLAQSRLGSALAKTGYE